MRREARLWIEAAKEDLFDAGDALRRGRWFRVAFFSHQAVEKALKALFFVVRREEPPHVHTVTELYRPLKDSGFVLPPELEEQLYILNRTSITPSRDTPTLPTASQARQWTKSRQRGPTAWRSRW
jgi:HEPN domain-containing protein